MINAMHNSIKKGENMTNIRELNDKELENVTGGIEVNGINYKYTKGTRLRSDGQQEYIIAEVLEYAVIDGYPAYELYGTTYIKDTNESASMQGIVRESVLDSGGYYIIG